VGCIVAAFTYSVLKRRRQSPQPEQPKQRVKEKLSIHGTQLVTPNSVHTLASLAERFDVYLVFQVINDQIEQQIRLQLAQVSIPAHHLLFCETQRGIQACIRQLGARKHLESDIALAKTLKQVMNEIVMVTSDQCEGFKQVQDLEQFLSSVPAEKQ
jgi:hypothetical protein